MSAYGEDMQAMLDDLADAGLILERALKHIIKVSDDPLCIELAEEALKEVERIYG